MLAKLVIRRYTPKINCASRIEREQNGLLKVIHQMRDEPGPEFSPPISLHKLSGLRILAFQSEKKLLDYATAVLRDFVSFKYSFSPIISDIGQKL